MPRLVVCARVLAALFFAAAGANHFIAPAFYERIVPPALPAPGLLVTLSGAFEVLGGVGLLIAPLRRWAAWGLIALLVAVFPANIYMVLSPEWAAPLHLPEWVLWARLPMQGVLMAWVWWVGTGNQAGRADKSSR